MLGALGAKMVPRGSLFEHFWGPWSKRGDNGITFLSMLGTLGAKMVPLGSVFAYVGSPWSKHGDMGSRVGVFWGPLDA